MHCITMDRPTSIMLNKAHAFTLALTYSKHPFPIKFNGVIPLGVAATPAAASAAPAAATADALTSLTSANTDGISRCSSCRRTFELISRTRGRCAARRRNSRPQRAAGCNRHIHGAVVRVRLVFACVSATAAACSAKCETRRRANAGRSIAGPTRSARRRGPAATCLRVVVPIDSALRSMMKHTACPTRMDVTATGTAISVCFLDS